MRRAVAKGLGARLSASKIARAAGCHVRTVFRHKSRAGRSPDQPSLFE